MRAEERLKGGKKIYKTRGKKNPCQAWWGIILFPTTLVLLNVFFVHKVWAFWYRTCPHISGRTKKMPWWTQILQETLRTILPNLVKIWWMIEGSMSGLCVNNFRVGYSKIIQNAEYYHLEVVLLPLSRRIIQFRFRGHSSKTSGRKVRVCAKCGWPRTGRPWTERPQTFFHFGSPYWSTTLCLVALMGGTSCVSHCGISAELED